MLVCRLAYRPNDNQITMHNMNDFRICFIGDSYVQGVGDSECLGWAGRLCVNARRAGHNVTGYNLGVRRETSADIARRWVAECTPRLPANTENHLVFSFGLNDVTIENGARRISEEDTLTNLRTILTAAKPRYRTLVIGPVAVPEAERNTSLLRLSNGLAKVAAELEVSYLPLIAHFIEDEQWKKDIRENDGAHPQAAGYAKIAALIEAWPQWWFRT